jgi:hypothetical protein
MVLPATNYYNAPYTIFILATKTDNGDARILSAYQNNWCVRVDARKVIHVLVAGCWVGGLPAPTTTTTPIGCIRTASQTRQTRSDYIPAPTMELAPTHFTDGARYLLPLAIQAFLKVRFDGTQLSMCNSLSASAGPLGGLCFSACQGEAGNSYIAEIVIYNKLLSTFERENVEGCVGPTHTSI